MAIVGAGGIGFDVADFLTHDGPHIDIDPQEEVPLAKKVDTAAVKAFLDTWGIDSSIQSGGLSALSKSKESKAGEMKQVYLLQRKKGKLGASLGKTTGWIHRTTMKMRGVIEISGCEYVKVTDAGLVIKRDGKEETLNVNTVVICAGQEPLRTLLQPLTTTGKSSSPNGKLLLIYI